MFNTWPSPPPRRPNDKIQHLLEDPEAGLQWVCQAAKAVRNASDHDIQRHDEMMRRSRSATGWSNDLEAMTWLQIRRQLPAHLSDQLGKDHGRLLKEARGDAKGARTRESELIATYVNHGKKHQSLLMLALAMLLHRRLSAVHQVWGLVKRKTQKKADEAQGAVMAGVLEGLGEHKDFMIKTTRCC